MSNESNQVSRDHDVGVISVATDASSPLVVVQHWFDFICPFCYIAQDRNRILRGHGIQVSEHALQIHPEIGPGGALAGPRVGSVYEFLAREADAAGLPLRWTDRMPHSRPALAAFEWLNESSPEIAERFAAAVFAAYFAEGEDIESVDLLASLAKDAGGDDGALRAALSSTAANDALVRSELLAHDHGVESTPTWVADGRKTSGLQPRQWFEDWAGTLTR
jgi:predicted DsbA family dithiol-disulfide isomerase